jgi:hypothetical protein
MNPLPLGFLLLVAAALFLVPRRWAAVPLLVAACYVPIGEGIELGSLSLPVYRVMLALGLIRCLLRGEGLAGGFNTVDRLMVLWSGWVLLASFFHLSEPGSGPVYASGYVVNVALSYFLIRAWCQSVDEAEGLLKAIALLLVPLAVSMLLEHVLYKNLFSMLGGVPEEVYVRDGKIRAQGPFQHPILAGTVGSVCVAYMVALWRHNRTFALVGLAASIAMALSSGSSGPLMSMVVAACAVATWRVRDWMWGFRWGAVLAYLLLELVMPAPAYYIISKFDFTGSSTGWHRSRLIESAIDHFSEWWLFGTDYTVHWIGLTNWSERHSDITNYYLSIGVVAGFPALLLVLFMIGCGFVWVGRLLRSDLMLPQHRFTVWCLGAGLFAYALSSLSVSFFDQSVVFFWLNVAVISSVYSSVATQRGGVEITPATASPHGSLS